MTHTPTAHQHRVGSRLATSLVLYLNDIVAAEEAISRIDYVASDGPSMIEVTVSRGVAFSRIDGGGTRRVRCADGTVLVFSSVSQPFAELPPEVAADPYLEKRAVGAAPAPYHRHYHGNRGRWPILRANRGAR